MCEREECLMSLCNYKKKIPSHSITITFSNAPFPLQIACHAIGFKELPLYFLDVSSSLIFFFFFLFFYFTLISHCFLY